MTVSCALFTLMCFTSKDEDKKQKQPFCGGQCGNLSGLR